MGVGFLPSRVTGFSAMSRRQMMMFMEGRQRRENSAPWACWPGADWRLILRWTFLSGIWTSVVRVIGKTANSEQITATRKRAWVSFKFKEHRKECLCYKNQEQPRRRGKPHPYKSEPKSPHARTACGAPGVLPPIQNEPKSLP